MRSYPRGKRHRAAELPLVPSHTPSRPPTTPPSLPPRHPASGLRSAISNNTIQHPKPPLSRRARAALAGLEWTGGWSWSWSWSWSSSPPWLGPPAIWGPRFHLRVIRVGWSGAQNPPTLFAARPPCHSHPRRSMYNVTIGAPTKSQIVGLRA